MSKLTAGERVWVTDTRTSGTVLQNHSTPRSYLVDLPQGVVRCNRSHLIPLHTPTKDRGSPTQQIPETTPEQAPVTPADSDRDRPFNKRQNNPLSSQLWWFGAYLLAYPVAWAVGGWSACTKVLTVAAVLLVSTVHNIGSWGNVLSDHNCR
ncbi:hypothetical protein N1851_000190 [Merluccius polli]|uniref:Uncharacterized protein n=1 Tax=Merluccius polli TaxID=89951 RepID=A0AA47NDZ6_MERPO|nr:hypothetical protein N1851_000190 [Merluccius polli]